MKNILVLGNSHVGALKAGFDLVTSEELNYNNPHLHNINFAGIPGKSLRNFDLNSNLDLVPKKCYGFTEKIHHDFEKELKCIPLGEFDLIAIVQGPSPLYPFLYCSDDENISKLSSSLIKSICNSLWISDYWSRISDKWKEFDRFTYISPCIRNILKNKELKTVYIGTPVPSRKCLNGIGRNYLQLDTRNTQEWNGIFNQIWSICEEMNSYNNNFSSRWYLPCPEIIDKDQLYTSNHFFESAKDVCGINRASDGWHANAEYGKTIILDFLKKIKAFSS